MSDKPKKHNWVVERFRHFAHSTSERVGSPAAFFLALLTIIVWCATGPIYHYSDTWQLVINTGTTIITFLMVFLIQNAQNREAKAIQLKLDELLRGVKGARTALIKLEDMSDEDLEELHLYFQKLRLQEIKSNKTGVNAKEARPSDTV